MKTKHGIALLALLLGPLSARAQFEGVAEMKITSQDSTGKGTFYVSPSVGARSEIEMKLPDDKKSKESRSMLPGGVFKMVSLQKLSEPDTTYLINDERKVYSVIDLKKVREMGARASGKPADDEYTVKKLGSDKVAGYACENALVTGKRSESEVCIARDILGASALAARMGRNESREGLMKALHDAGLEGFPIRMVTKEKGKEISRMELTRVEKKSLPRSLFEVPAGYEKESMMGAMMPPEAAQKMKEAMEKMTPEQRRQMEEMMKKAAERQQ